MASVSIEMAGKTYNLTSHDNGDRIIRIAEHLTEKFRQQDERPLSSQDKLVLTAANIAEDYIDICDCAENLRSRLREYMAEADDLRAQLEELKKIIE